MAGLRDGLAERGIPLPASRIRLGSFSSDFGESAAAAPLSSARPPTALFCGNDVIAVGALNACARAGIRPGTDVSIVGFDDIGLASWDICRLTTVRCNLSELADRAVRLLVGRIADPTREPRNEVLVPELVLRHTHAPPPDRTA